ncbi:GNAT family N-acetyltransferase [Alkalicoccus saliphilus]|uniref:GNAT family N-acetyltransferase n=1 Tax=Alkalicoccus saliphilus TaxID=200989 RepID=A0A2T4U221_9BACI|nr:GNAT family N-acetyltransferase [Alkalicoccus saliphilus]PTL37450.1 GNAT family N-acetyltransferase [Alkalicoccus saliphilus]
MNGTIYVRPYTPEDYDELLLIQKEAFPPPFPEDLWWSREHIQSHAEVFPEGAMIAFDGKEPAGSATALITTLTSEPHTWEEAADDGYIRKSHDPKGDTLYGIDVCVRPSFRGRGVAAALYEERKKLVQKLGLRRYAAGCRIPGFSRLADSIDVETYVRQVEKEELHDPVLTFMLKQGLIIHQIIPDYLEDEESRNYGVIVVWENPEVSG